MAAVNDVDQAIGHYPDSTFNNVGFLLDLATNTETILPFDGVGINDAEQIVGNLSSIVGLLATPGLTAVPEPTTFLLLTSCLLAAFNARRIVQQDGF